MPELLTPGVYMQEVAFGPQPIEGVSTSTAGFVGEAQWGPTSGPPTLVTSFPDFERKFGGFIKGKHLAYAVRGFFDNGGKRAYVSRVSGGDARPASAALKANGCFVRLAAQSIKGSGVTKLVLSSVVGLEIGADKITLFPINGGETYGAVSSTANAFPVQLAPGDKFTASVDEGADETKTVDAGPASLTTEGAIYAKVSGKELVLVINGTTHVARTTGNEEGIAGWLDFINESFPGIAAVNAAGEIKIVTDRKGTSASIAVGGATDLTVKESLGLDSPDIHGGSGDVADIDAVTAAELATILNGYSGATATVSSSGVVTVRTDTLGLAGSFQFVDESGTGVSKIAGFDFDLHKGSDIASISYNVLAVEPSSRIVTINGENISAGPQTHYARIVTQPDSTPVLELEAAHVGGFGNALSVLVEAQYVDNTSVKARLDAKTYKLGRVDFLKAGARVQLDVAGARAIGQIAAVDAASGTITLESDSGDDFSDGTLSLIAWTVSVNSGATRLETLDGLSAIPSEFGPQLDARSSWVRVKPSTSTLPALDPGHGQFPTFPFAQPVALAGGMDDDADSIDVIGSDVPRTGLKALEAQTGISIIAAPGFDKQEVVNELIGQAERRMDRFAVFGAESPGDQVGDLLAQRGQYNSHFAAMYGPWLTVADPLTKSRIAVPPAGHVIGAYARTDNDRGVFKAPANVVLRGVLGFSRVVPDGEQDILNPAGVNVLRHFDGLGNVIWGARTISSEGLWKYVPVRRLFIFLEQSIIAATRYAVFEPNDLRLWARIRDSVTNFLTSQWRAGALFGSKPEEAFFVKVDETTTTQDDRDNGRVNILVGIAPVKPAEFIVFQIGQAPNSIIIAERGA